MKNTFLLIILLIFVHKSSSAQIFSVKDGEISFFSKTAMEDIDAKNTNVNSFINTSNRELLFIVPVRSFQFKSKLMQEHFNENYMESDKFSSATYSGKINEEIDFTKEGTYDVTTTGKLKIHGVEKERTEKGTITVKNGNIGLQSSLKVLLKDFDIEIPKLVIKNIAEEMDINITINYVPYKK